MVAVRCPLVSRRARKLDDELTDCGRSHHVNWMRGASRILEAAHSLRRGVEPRLSSWSLGKSVEGSSSGGRKRRCRSHALRDRPQRLTRVTNRASGATRRPGHCA